MKIPWIICFLLVILSTSLAADKIDMVANGNIVWSHDEYMKVPIKKTGSFLWLDRSSGKKKWSQAKNYCSDIEYLDIDFELPTGPEIETLRFNHRDVLNQVKIGRVEAFWQSNGKYSAFLVGNRMRTNRDNFSDFKKYGGLVASLLCVSKQKYFFEDLSISALGKKIFEGKLRANSKLILESKPQKPSYEELTKDEFETTQMFRDRVKKSQQKIDTIYENKVKEWEVKIKNKKEEHQSNLQKMNTNGMYLHSIQEALHIQYRSPMIQSVQYNADKQVFDIQLQYIEKLQLPVKLKYAKQFKKILVDPKFEPIVEYEVVNNQLVFSGIQQIKDPELLVEENEYKKAYESILELKSFISKYPTSSVVPRAKSRISVLEEKARSEQELKARIKAQIKADRIAEAKRREEAKQRKIESYSSQKSTGDKVCTDGATALFLPITISAYVEKVNENKIQLLIADTEGTSPYYNGVTLHKNTLIWDNYNEWYKCN